VEAQPDVPDQRRREGALRSFRRRAAGRADAVRRRDRRPRARPRHRGALRRAHESPQAILFERGVAVWSASHGAITLGALHAAWAERC
jgi:hypothetical protein